MGVGVRRSAGRVAGLRRWARLLASLSAAVVGLASLSASAQQLRPFTAVPTIDRDRVDRIEPQVPAVPSTTPRPVESRVEEAGTSNLVLSRVRFEGSTLSPEHLSGASARFVGQKLTRETLQQIANAISGVYARSDVALYSVTIPRQSVAGGELVVRVMEGRIARYALRRETPSTPTRLIAEHMDRLMREQPTGKRRLERTLLLLRDIPGQSIDATLRTTARTDEVLLDLDVKRKQVDLALTIDNGGVANVVSGVQAQLSVGVHGVLREGDSTHASAYLPFQPGRYQSYALSHSTPLGSDGTRLSLSAAHVRTRTSDMEIRGLATQAGIGVSHPLIRSNRRNLSVGLSLDGVDSENYFLAAAFGGFRTRAVRASATWSATGTKRGYALAVTLSRSINGLGSRPLSGYSDASFAKANLQLAAVTELGKAAAFKATLRGQYSGDLLPTTERFALGGEGAGVVYRVGEITADRALAAGIELSRKVMGAGQPASKAPNVSVFAYADGALAHSLARPRFALPARDYSLATAGGGVRLSIGGWSGQAQIGVPLDRPVAQSRKTPRLLFTLGRTV